MSPPKKPLGNYTSLRRQNPGHWWHTLAFQGHRKGNTQKNLIRTSFRQSVCIQLCQQQASHLLQEEEEINKNNFYQDRVNPHSHSRCCGEADCNRVPVVHQPLPPCAGGAISGTWQGHSCPSDPALLPSFPQSPFITWPSADGPLPPDRSAQLTPVFIF